MVKHIKNHIGTSGWNYSDWRGSFYPSGTKRMLEFYASKFDTVEINTTFYGLPSAKSVGEWNEAVPKNFIFSIKGSRYITHRKKLNNPSGSLGLFLTSLSALKKKSGPFLFQLPPNWNFNGERLENFLKILKFKKKTAKIAIEIRNSNWYNPELKNILTKYGAALCFHDMPLSEPPEWITADFIYVRLHGFNGAYHGHYGKKSLIELADRIRKWNKKGMETFVYFNNDREAAAPFDALELIKILNS